MSPDIDPIFGEDEPANPLFIPYTRRVGELIHRPEVLERWREQCHESFQERQARVGRADAWQEKRREFAKNLKQGADRQKPAEGWEWQMEYGEGNAAAYRMVEGWFPPDLLEKNKPYAFGPLPFTQQHQLSKAECYFVLALVHDATRRDGRRINPFDRSDESKESLHWFVQSRLVSDLGEHDQVTLDECLRHVEADLKPLGEPPPAYEGNESLTLPDLAARFSLSAEQSERLRGRLKTWMKTNHDDWKEVTERKPREPRYLYRVAAVLPIINQLKSNAAKSSGERPAKKNQG
jgi:hypothetical protein